jgi:hypothetical protein
MLEKCSTTPPCPTSRGSVAVQISSMPDNLTARGMLDNNIVENDVRPSVVGRKRWLFIGHSDAGWRSAVIYTIIQSCRRRGVYPQEYLTDVLSRLPSMKNHEIKDVLPSCWRLRPIRPTEAQQLRRAFSQSRPSLKHHS